MGKATNLLSNAYLYLSGRLTKYIWDLAVHALPWQKQSHRETLRHQAQLANEWENKAGHHIFFSDRKAPALLCSVTKYNLGLNSQEGANTVNPISGGMYPSLVNL